jgi:hypothetical protein
MPRPPAKAFRLGDRHDAMLEQTATELRMTETEVIRVAIEDKYRRTFGRRPQEAGRLISGTLPVR